MNKVEKVIAKIVAIACAVFIITGLMCGMEICSMIGQHASCDATVVLYASSIIGAFALMMWALHALSKDEENNKEKDK